MNFDMFEAMYKLLTKLVYEILAIFGIEKDAEGNF